jgi:hypothetical protein
MHQLLIVVDFRSENLQSVKLDKTIFSNGKRLKWETKEKKIKANAKNKKKEKTH